MKLKLTAQEWWNDLVEYERTHAIAFAAPSALAEARLIAKLEKSRRSRRHQRNGMSPRGGTRSLVAKRR